MPVDLQQALSWKTADSQQLVMLQSLQGNILKGHGRHFTANLFFTIDTSRTRDARRMLRDLGNFHVTSAHRQLVDADRFKRSGRKKRGGRGAGSFVHLALSAGGYAALGLGDAAPTDPDFRRGMKHPDSIADLADPKVAEWEEPFRTDIHGVVIAAHETASQTGDLAGTLRTLIEEAGGKVFVQHGAALFNAAQEGIEHFGYVDGRSQPLMLIEDIDEETEAAGTNRWDPCFALKIALVRDPGVPLPDGEAATSFGSYLVFRKLEQHVRAFKTREQEVATKLGLKGAERELAGAMIVGRFEDGTPVTLSNTARGLKPPNNFDYTGDAGARCPFHAHIRKSNPRGSGGAPGDEAGERTHLMPRRGIPYEDARREVPPSELPDADSMAEFRETVAPKLPVRGVGLLFMAYNANIGDQFKFTQATWVNNPGFPLKPPGPHGIDPVIGQDGRSDAEHQAMTDQALPKVWDDPSKGVSNGVGFGGFVRMKGGEYFFSPSLTFLQDL